MSDDESFLSIVMSDDESFLSNCFHSGSSVQDDESELNFCLTEYKNQIWFLDLFEGEYDYGDPINWKKVIQNASMGSEFTTLCKESEPTDKSTCPTIWLRRRSNPLLRGSNALKQRKMMQRIQRVGLYPNVLPIHVKYYKTQFESGFTKLMIMTPFMHPSVKCLLNKSENLFKKQKALRQILRPFCFSKCVQQEGSPAPSSTLIYYRNFVHK